MRSALSPRIHKVADTVISMSLRGLRNLCIVTLRLMTALLSRTPAVRKVKRRQLGAPSALVDRQAMRGRPKTVG